MESLSEVLQLDIIDQHLLKAIGEFMYQMSL